MNAAASPVDITIQQSNRAGAPMTTRQRKSQRRCSVVDCEKPHKARGLCLKHYRRWQRTGHPLGAEVLGWPSRSTTPEEVIAQCWAAHADLVQALEELRLQR